MKLKLDAHIHIEDAHPSHALDALFGVYQRILGTRTIGVYGYFKYAPKHQALLVETVLNDLNLQMMDFIQALEHLQQFELIRLFEHQERYWIHLIPPKSLHDFLSHDVFGRIALKQLGLETYERLRQNSLSKGLFEGYQELTFPLDKSFMQNWSALDEEHFKQAEPLPIPQLGFDIKRFLQQASDFTFPMKKRTAEAIGGIQEIGSVFGLSVDQMIRIVAAAHVENDAQLNLERVRKLAAKEEVTEISNPSDRYQLPPVVFLKQLRHYVEPTKLEKYVLQNLLSTYPLAPAVINVLVEANYQHNHENLHIRQLETLAVKWASLKIQTKEDALAQVQKSFKSTRLRRVEKPSLFEVKPHEDMSEAEEIAMLEAFKNLGEPQ